jgi:hypothetical protein
MKFRDVIKTEKMGLCVSLEDEWIGGCMVDKTWVGMGWVDRLDGRQADSVRVGLGWSAASAPFPFYPSLFVTFSSSPFLVLSEKVLSFLNVHVSYLCKSPSPPSPSHYHTPLFYSALDLPFARRGIGVGVRLWGFHGGGSYHGGVL